MLNKSVGILQIIQGIFEVLYIHGPWKEEVERVINALSEMNFYVKGFWNPVKITEDCERVLTKIVEKYF